MRKTVKLMISISNKSNPIITNSSLISNEIMRCLHQHQMLIYWRVTTIQPIPIQIGITIIIIDIRMPHQVRKVRINFYFFFSSSYFISVLAVFSCSCLMVDFIVIFCSNKREYQIIQSSFRVDDWLMEFRSFFMFNLRRLKESVASHMAFATFLNVNNLFYGNKRA